MGCRAWSPDATRLLCQAIRFEGDPSLNGMYTIRAADGRGLRRLTFNPYPAPPASPPESSREGISARERSATTRPLQRPTLAQVPEWLEQRLGQGVPREPADVG
jgi:hypothetical protein